MKKTLLRIFAICVFTNLTAQDITTGLVFHLTCDSATDLANNATVTESSSSTASGTVVNGVTSVAGANGSANSAFNFASGTYINFAPGDLANLPLGDVGASGRSYSLWMKTPNNTDRMTAFNYGAQSAAQHVHLNINQTTSNQLNLGFWQTETTQTATPYTAVTDDNWHHVAINVTKITGGGYSSEYYIDNVLVETSSYTGANEANTTIPTATGGDVDFRIGARNDLGASALPYIGSLDDIRFYNRTLTAADVQALYLANGGTLSTFNYATITDFKVFPTVASDVLQIESNEDLKELSIVNLSGVVIKKIEASKEINVSNLSSGLYFIIGKSDTGIGTSKFIKK